VQLFPNPSKGRFLANFKSEQSAALTLKMIDANSGAIVLQKSINAVAGNNSVPVELNQRSGTTAYILTIEGDAIRYLPKKMFIQP